jgi:hypothetical protein
MAPRLNKRQQREMEELDALNAKLASESARDNHDDDEEEEEDDVPVVAKPKVNAGFAAVCPLLMISPNDVYSLVNGRRWPRRGRRWRGPSAGFELEIQEGKTCSSTYLGL